MPNASAPRSPSVAERYFIDRFHAATLQGAVERAAYGQRMHLILNGRSGDTVRFEAWHNLPVNADFCDIPVDVERIAEQAGIHIVTSQSNLGRAEGRLLPACGGFCVQLKEPVSQTRKRFTLAHEIGHTLFYSCDGSWPQHQINRTSRQEYVAEERICDLFAMALLMPASRLRQKMPVLSAIPLPYLIHNLQEIAGQFNVSILPLISRLHQIRPQSVPYLILHLKFREHSVTGADPQLRLQGCFGFGGAKNWTVWKNRSVAGIGLRSVASLFEAWKEELVEQREPTGGRYVWNTTHGLQRASKTSDVEAVEQVNVGVMKQGKWQKAVIPMRVVNCLFASPAATEREAYILVFMTPCQEPP